MAPKTEGVSPTSNVVEKVTGWAYIGGFISLIITIAFMGMSGSPYTWIPVCFLIADVIGGLVFAASNSIGVRQAAAAAAILIFMVAAMDAFTRMLNALYFIFVETRAWLEIIMNAQPNINTTVGQISLGLEIGFAMVLGIVAFIAITVRNKNWDKKDHWDPKHTVALVLILYALAKNMLPIMLLMILISLGFVNLVKNRFQDGAKSAEAEASKRGWSKFALFISASAFVVAAFIFTPMATWIGGIAVIYSTHPFTTLTFVVVGSVIGGWYALK